MANILDKKCLNCKLPKCNNCIGKSEKDKERAANREYCKTYYQRHRKECIERTLKNKAKKREKENIKKGYDMAIYI